MTRILATADLHIGARLLTLDEQAAALAQVVVIAKREAVDIVVAAGDDAHPLRNPSTAIIEILGRFYRALADAGIDVVLIAGNHAADLAPVEQHYGGLVHVALSAQVLHVRGVDIACLPFLPDAYVRARHAGELTKTEVASKLTQYAAEFVESLASQRRPGVPLVFAGHATVLGSKTSTGFDMTNLAMETWHLSAEDLSRLFDFSIVGHVHKHQVLAPNVVIPGSVQPVDFSEIDPHGVVLVDVEPAEIVGGSSVRWRFVPLEGLPEIATLDLDRPGLETLAFAAPETIRRLDGAKIRVRITCDEATAREFPPSRIEAALRERGASLVQVELNLEGTDRARDDGMTDDLSPGRALARWVETADVDDATRVRILARGAEAIATVADRQPTAAGANLQLVAIEARDFIGIREADVIFDGDGVWAITGAVGTGKSTIGADAVRYAIHGASRAGARSSDQLIRDGADVAMAAVRLRSGDREFKIIRKLKRGSSGKVSGSLDVLEKNGGGWHPLSDGKLVSGQAVVDELLGGLDDETMTASNIVVQRAADAFTRARPEQRKGLLARAAGLGLYDLLADVSRDRGRLADRGLAQLHAAAGPLRARATAIGQLELDLAAATATHMPLEMAIAELEERGTALAEQMERLAGKTAEHERILTERIRVDADLNRIVMALAEWDRRKTAADRILAERAALEQARADLGAVRGQIVALEAQLVADMDAVAARQAAIARQESREAHLSAERQKREQESRGLDRLIDEARRRGHLIEEALCCAPEPSCLFLVDARKAVAGIPALEAKVVEHAEPSAAEVALAAEIAALVIPAAPDPAITKGRLTKARGRAAELEREAAVAEKIARAEQIIVEHAIAIGKLAAEHARDRADVDRLTAEIDVVAQAVTAYTLAKRHRDLVTEALAVQRRGLGTAIEIGARIAGRLETAREAAAELSTVEARITDAAADVTAWDALVTAWRDCRVLTLESSVIPAVERTANDVLRRFPYGLQLALRTQRDRKSGDGVSETLDIDVLGGKGPSYEMCSGGQRTALDISLHIAIALVVSRRTSTRISYLFLDEPEGLDEPGRLALAGIARWIHETFGLSVLLASHSSDLVDALGAREIVVSPGEHGSTVAIR